MDKKINNYAWNVLMKYTGSGFEGSPSVYYVQPMKYSKMVAMYLAVKVKYDNDDANTVTRPNSLISMKLIDSIKMYLDEKELTSLDGNTLAALNDWVGLRQKTTLPIKGEDELMIELPNIVGPGVMHRIDMSEFEDHELRIEIKYNQNQLIRKDGQYY